jgi:protein-S-isoprenylcysteine O-methyltransferase Ste14
MIEDLTGVNAMFELDVLRWLTALLCLACFISFGWGIKGFFVKPTKKSLPMYFVSELGTLFALLHLALFITVPEAGSVTTLILGCVLYLSSLLLFWSSIYTNRQHPLTFAYSTDQPAHLVQSGPYRLVRHPFYTAYILCWFGTPLALQIPWLAISSLIMTLVYRGSAIQEEVKFLRSDLATSAAILIIGGWRLASTH